MNTRAFLRYCLSASVFLLFSCHDKADDATPQQTAHEVAVQVVGQNIPQTLDAYLTISTQLKKGNSVTAGPAISTECSGDSDQTYNLGTLSRADFVGISIAFYNTYSDHTALAASPVIIPPTTKLTARLLIDGQVRRAVTLDATQSGPNVLSAPYLRGLLAVDLGTL